MSKNVDKVYILYLIAIFAHSIIQKMNLTCTIFLNITNDKTLKKLHDDCENNLNSHQ